MEEEEGASSVETTGESAGQGSVVVESPTEPVTVEDTPTPEPAATEAAEPEPAPEPEPLGVESMFGDEAPPWVTALDKLREAEGGDSFKGVDIADVKDPVAQKLLYNFRKLAMRTSDEAAQARKAAQTELSQVQEERAQLAQVMSQMMGVFGGDKVKAMLAVEEPKDADPYSQDYQAYQVKKEVAEFMQQFLGGLQGEADTWKQAAAEAAAERAKAAQLTELKAFAAEHPDFHDHIDNIRRIVHATRDGDNPITAIEAYHLVRKEAAPVESPRERRQTQRERSQRAAGRAGRGSQRHIQPTRDVQQLAQLVKENPDEVKAIAEDMKRGGVHW